MQAPCLFDLPAGLYRATMLRTNVIQGYTFHWFNVVGVGELPIADKIFRGETFVATYGLELQLCFGPVAHHVSQVTHEPFDIRFVEARELPHGTR